jgi:long-chain fatty acid transport protein
VRLNSLILILIAVCACYAASLIGTDALGLEQAPRNAAIIRSGFSPANPAIYAFENQTKFGTTIQYEYAEAQKSDNALSLNSFAMPSLSMVLPLGFLGTLGIALEQKYFANNRIELEEQALYSSRAGIYELLPSYSIRLPLFLSNFAIGVSYRVFFGNSYSSLERKSGDWGDDSWMANGIYITEKERGEFKQNDGWQRNFGGSLHYHSKNADYFISYFPSVQKEKNISSNVQFSNTDTLKTEKSAKNFKLPKRFASGIHFRFWQNQNLSLVYEHQSSMGAIDLAHTETNAETQKYASYFLEYKISGTGLHYSPFFKRNDFGINGWYAERYLKDVNEYGGSLFTDLWLGRRGTIVGLALFGGYRQAKEHWDELFFGFKLNLTGVGNWGTSYRRR